MKIIFVSILVVVISGCHSVGSRSQWVQLNDDKPSELSVLPIWSEPEKEPEFAKEVALLLSDENFSMLYYRGNANGNDYWIRVISFCMCGRNLTTVALWSHEGLYNGQRYPLSNDPEKWLQYSPGKKTVINKPFSTWLNRGNRGSKTPDDEYGIFIEALGVIP